MVNLKDKTGECIHILRLGKYFLNRLQKRVNIKDNTDKLGYIKVKNFHSSEVTSKSEKKKKSQSRRRYLYYIHLTKNSYPIYKKKFYKPVRKRPNIKLTRTFNRHFTK